MVIEGVAIGVILVMTLFPETPAARLLHAHFVAKPAAWTRQHLIFAAMLVGLAFAGGEFVMLAGGADLAMLMAWDMALAFDVMIAVWTAAAMSRFGAMRNYLLAKLHRAPRQQARPRSVRRRKPARKAANDDEAELGTLAA